MEAEMALLILPEQEANDLLQLLDTMALALSELAIEYQQGRLTNAYNSDIRSRSQSPRSGLADSPDNTDSK
jgi:hypothetical protein